MNVSRPVRQVKRTHKVEHAQVADALTLHPERWWRGEDDASNVHRIDETSEIGIEFFPHASERFHVARRHLLVFGILLTPRIIVEHNGDEKVDDDEGGESDETDEIDGREGISATRADGAIHR